MSSPLLIICAIILYVFAAGISIETPQKPTQLQLLRQKIAATKNSIWKKLGELEGFFHKDEKTSSEQSALPTLFELARGFPFDMDVSFPSPLEIDVHEDATSYEIHVNVPGLKEVCVWVLVS